MNTLWTRISRPLPRSVADVCPAPTRASGSAEARHQRQGSRENHSAVCNDILAAAFAAGRSTLAGLASKAGLASRASIARRTIKAINGLNIIANVDGGGRIRRWPRIEILAATVSWGVSLDPTSRRRRVCRASRTSRLQQQNCPRHAGLRSHTRHPRPTGCVVQASLRR